jgi:DNA-binding IclR family transcriptional regulator
MPRKKTQEELPDADASRDDERYRSAVAVERAADLLVLIAERGEASVTDLAREIGSSGSAVHRILTALKNKGFVEQRLENGPYSLSWSVLALTRRLATGAELRTLSLPLMHELRDLTGETTTLSVRAGFDRVCIDQVESTHEVRWRHEIGRVSPLYAGATGKAVLAHLDSAELTRYFRAVKLERLTPYTTTDQAALRSELDRVRAQGYAIDRNDRIIGAGGIAAPIFGPEGFSGAVLTIAGPAERCTFERLQSWIEPLSSAAHRIGVLLGDAQEPAEVEVSLAGASRR